MDGPWIPSRLHNKIIFQFPLMPVIDHIHSRVKSMLDQFSVLGDAGKPMCRILPDEVVADARQLLGWFKSRIGLSRLKFEAKDRRGGQVIDTMGRLSIFQKKNGFLVCHKQGVAPSPGQKFHLGIGLSLIGFESQG